MDKDVKNEQLNVIIKNIKSGYLNNPKDYESKLKTLKDSLLEAKNPNDARNILLLNYTYEQLIPPVPISDKKSPKKISAIREE